MKMYAPTTFIEGSSLSHIDPSLPTVMNPQIGQGETMRSYTSLDLAMLQDLG